MSAAIISPVIPPLLPRDSDRVAGVPGVVSMAHRSLPLPSLIMRRTTALVYGLSAVDDRGRLADRTILQALGWSAGLGLDISETNGRLVICPREHGAFHVTGQGHLRIPALLRHRCGLEPGDRVLLAADPHQRQLVAYPPGALDALIGRQATNTSDGESI